MDINKFFKFCFNINPDIFPETAIITPFIPTKLFEKKCKKIKTFKGAVYSGTIVEKNKHRFAVIRSGMGASLTGDAVLFMKNTPVRRIIFAGACGGLNDAKIGDIILCKNAFSGEAFSAYHVPEFTIKSVLDNGNLMPAHTEYFKSAESFLSGKLKKTAVFRTGDIFSIGSFLAETAQNLSEIEKHGFLGIDLELSSVYHAASLSNIEAIGLVFVSDLPKTKPLWGDRAVPDTKNYKNGFDKLVQSAMELSVSLA